ncbi:Piwi domain protein [Trichostrongylus colubriformis]|uniref:Piwi domain protein n=1 Tax=Trichostrongylus colubriformis TaxID=6319 RepID=A0AAN8FSH5_TRICO
MSAPGGGGDAGKAVVSKKAILTEAEAKLQALSLQSAPPVMAKNAAPGTLGDKYCVQTNAFGVQLDKPMAFWRYDVTIYAEIRRGGRKVYFTKKGRDDYLIMNRNYKCKLIYDAVIRMNQDFFDDPSLLWYDGQSILFSGKDLYKGRDHQVEMKFHISGKDCKHPSLSVIETITFDIIPVKEGYCMSLTEKVMLEKTANSDLSQNDHSITQFMELIFNQVAVTNPQEHAVFENGKVFICHPWLYGFTEKDCPDVGGGKRLYPGTQKSVRFVEGPGGRDYNNPALIIDAKKAAFHEEIRLIEKAKAILGGHMSDKVTDFELERLNTGLKGLFFYTKYRDYECDHQIAGVVSHTANDTIFEDRDGRKISVRKYFEEKYNIELEYPDAPLVKVRERGRTNNYPMELGILRPMQRVTIPQQTEDQSHKTTRSCAVAPGERQDNIARGARALKLFGSEENPYVANAGLFIFKQPMKVDARLLPPPKLKYRDEIATVRDGKWRTPRGHLLIPAECGVWAVYGLVARQSKESVQKLVVAFAEMFFREATNHGIRLPHPSEIKVTGHEKELEDLLRNASKHNCKYCLIVSADSIKTMHKIIKLWERELEMVTQDVKLSNVEKVVKEKRAVTLENILLKANLKLGGLNYEIEMNGLLPSESVKNWIRSGRLFLGIGVSHAPPTSHFERDKAAPSVVGYAANFKTNRYDFVGDYLFQSSRREETLNTMSEIVNNVFPKFAENHDGKFPRDLIIYRSGLSEGSFSTVLTHEIPLLRGALSSLGVKNIRIVFIVVQKEHNVRLMLERIDRSRRPTEQNIPPGVVVDQQLTHPSFKEFYLNSHITLQGSARTPRYTVLVDDLDLSMDELEGMTYVLTYDHQIVNLPTSLPTPLYVANRYAERGRNTYTAHLISSGSSGSSDSGSSVDFGRLAHRLSYNNTRLCNIRVNA